MKIRALVTIAAKHNSSISTEDLFSLLPRDAFSSPDDLERFILGDPSLQDATSLNRGEVTLKGSENLALGQPDRTALSAWHSERARSFSSRLVRLCPWVRLVALSGSMAYRGTKGGDDVDFFIVTRRNRVWITLLVAMLAARIYRKRHKDPTVLCFNRILEEDECRNAFKSVQDTLFAREALSLTILNGHGYYRDLLESAPWMGHVFPRLFQKALGSPNPDNDGIAYRPGPIWSILNGASFVALTPYLTIVGHWRNRRLRRSGNLDARFRTIIRRGFFAYESRRYDLLRETYRESFQEA